MVGFTGIFREGRHLQFAVNRAVLIRDERERSLVPDRNGKQAGRLIGWLSFSGTIEE